MPAFAPTSALTRSFALIFTFATTDKVNQEMRRPGRASLIGPPMVARRPGPWAVMTSRAVSWLAGEGQ
jgi:hypothetical protein